MAKLDVLVAEDNPVNRYLIEKLLERLGQAVTVVEDGAQALAAVEARLDRPFDLILMDIQMPVMDGEEAARAIRSLAEPAGSTPICAVTAEDSYQRRRALHEAGIDEVLAKPIRIDSLARVLRSFGSRSTVDLSPDMPDHLVSGEPKAALDPTRLRSLEETLGRGGRDRLLELLVDDANDRPQIMRRHIEDGRPDLAALDAHALKGAASIVGADRLVAVLQSLIDKAREAKLDQGLLPLVESEAAAVVTEGRALLQAADA